MLCLMIGIGCAHDARRPLTAYNELEARTAKVLKVMDRLVASLEAASDCPQMAFALRHFSQHAPEINELGKLRLQLSDSERARFDYDHEDDADLLRRVHAAANRCLNDPETHIAYETAGFWH